MDSPSCPSIAPLFEKTPFDPRYGDKRGHPVFATRRIAEELLALPLTAKASDVVHGHVNRTQYVDVDDSGILVDVDDPAAYRRLMEKVS
jgi:CTP:molybdopterin cytidylyltransferase MocA